MVVAISTRKPIKMTNAVRTAFRRFPGLGAVHEQVRAANGRSRELAWMR
jgi:hypothetical protein